MGARYYYSRKVILGYLDCALHTDMADLEAYYMKPAGERGRLKGWSGSVGGGQRSSDIRIGGCQTLFIQ